MSYTSDKVSFRTDQKDLVKNAEPDLINRAISTGPYQPGHKGCRSWVGGPN
jgi:hypothetical protein